MAGTLTEQARLLQADIEINSKKIVDELAKDTKTVKDRIAQETRVATRLQTVLDAGGKLIELYQDQDGTRQEELSSLAGDQVFTTFYDRLRETREYHKRNPTAVLQQQPSASSAITGVPGLGDLNTTPALPPGTAAAEGKLPGPGADQKENDGLEVKITFTPDEQGGQYVDLHAFFTRYINMKTADNKGTLFPKADFLQYLARFHKLSEVKKEEKMKKYTEYRTYVEELSAYLVSFLQRTNPFAPVEKMVALISEEFDKKWQAKQVTGWFAEAGGANGGNAMDTGESKVNGSSLFCEACQQSYGNKNVYDHHLNGKKHRNAAAALASGAPKQGRADQERELAAVEDRVAQLAELLKDQIQATLAHIEKKQTRSYDELEAEREAQAQAQAQAQQQAEEEDDDPNKPIYNPKNVPLGWDGKPIPYWLYKLHGLNIEYKCEICGGYSYWGPRTFEKHFKEWRHAYGMRCLGIKYTDDFLNITIMQDAVALNDKLKAEQTQQQWKAEEEEEYEDREGNVYSRKTYEDLRRQGLI